MLLGYGTSRRLLFTVIRACPKHTRWVLGLASVVERPGPVCCITSGWRECLPSTRDSQDARIPVPTLREGITPAW